MYVCVCIGANYIYTDVNVLTVYYAYIDAYMSDKYVYVYICGYVYVCICRKDVCVYVCMRIYVYPYEYMFVCMRMYMYIDYIFYWFCIGS